MPRAPSSETFAHLVREHHATVYQSAWRVLRSSADAEDAAQQVFLEVLEGKLDLARAVDAGRVLRWRAVRAALMHLRSAGRRREHEGVHAMATQHTQEQEPSSLESHETRVALERGLLTLPMELALALELRFRESLSYEEIAEACACSAATAHERVKKALERLRGELSRAGFAALVPDLDHVLRPPSAPPVPGDLPLRLLALHAPAASASLLSLGALALLFGAGITFWSLQSAGNARSEVATLRADSSPAGESQARLASAPETEDTRAARLPEAAEPASAAPVQTASAPNVLAAPRRSWITGVLVDEHGNALPALQVRADSLLRSGKSTRYEARAITRADGWFRLEIELADAAEESFVLYSASPDYVVREEPVVRAKSGVEVRSADLVAFGDAPPPVAPYELELEVVDRAGRALPRIPVHLSRAIQNPRVRYEDLNLGWESGGLTDAEGRITLRGTTLGEKRLVIEAREQGWRAHTELVRLEHEGHSSLRVALERGLAITGTLRGLDGTLPAHPMLYILVSLEEWHMPSIDEAGHVRFDGLDPGPHTIEARANGYSTARFEAEAGAPPLDFALKRADDLRDLGAHLGELHGTVVDAAGGQPVDISFWDLRVEAVSSLSRAEFERDEWPHVWFERPRQVAEDPFAEPEVRKPAFHVTGLEPGRYALIVSVEGYAPALLGPLEIRGRELVRGLRAELVRGARLAGRVLDDAGAPLAHAFVLLNGEGEASTGVAAQIDRELAQNGGRGTVGYGPGVFTDEHGAFAFDCVPPGLRCVPWVLHAQHAARAGEPFVLAPGALREGLELRAGPPR